MWNQLFRKLYRIFYKNGSFYYKQPSGVQWSVNFQKYVVRVLKNFPKDDYYCHRDECSLLEYIRKQLNYIHTTIIPFFAAKSYDDTNNVVTKDKPILWFKKRKKAIAITKNNGEWPKNVNVSITTNRNKLYFDSSVKYTSENNFTPEEKRYFDREAMMNTIHRCDYFSVDEIEGIVKSCPNGKSCADSVFYEDLKNMFPD